MRRAEAFANRDAAVEALTRAGKLAPSGAADMGSAVNAGRNYVTLKPATEVKLVPVRWAWKYYLPAGMLALLSGVPGGGKTTLAIAIAAVLTRGTPWPDGAPCEVGDVVMWSGEDDQSVLAARFAACSADLSRVRFVCTSEGEFDPATDIALLEAAMLELPAPRLLIVDPIVQAVSGDGHKSNDVRRSLAPLVALAQRMGCCVIGITHFSKGTAGRDPVERVTGSVAFGALARVVLVAAKGREEDGGRRVFVIAKSNCGPDYGGFEYELDRVDVAPGVEGQRVIWGDRIEGNARDVLHEAETPDEGDAGEPDEAAVHEADDALRRVLGRGPMPKRDVDAAMRANGFTPKQTRSARERIGVIVKRTGFAASTASTWQLPEGAHVPHDEPDDATPGAIAPSCPLGASLENEGTKGTTGHERSFEGTKAGFPADEVTVL